MRIVLDTNVLVAGLLNPFGPCGEIVRMVSAGDLILLWDARVLAEYADVLARPKFNFDPVKIRVLLDFSRHYGLACGSIPLAVRLPDPDDEPFLEVAAAGRADALVTGILSHFPSAPPLPVPVLPPAGFLAFYRERLAGER
ncbi:MAG: putative toxin-antitoxin system toxin component, PIN family [Acidobacteria bacterium]|nr:putative toxin-antitoxin system toxin component, PIN family [Acidobacteriota bacterium]